MISSAAISKCDAWTTKKNFGGNIYFPGRKWWFKTFSFERLFVFSTCYLWSEKSEKCGNEMGFHYIILILIDISIKISICILVFWPICIFIICFFEQAVWVYFIRCRSWLIFLIIYNFNVILINPCWLIG